MKSLCSRAIAVAVVAGMVGAAGPAAAQNDPGYAYPEPYPAFFWEGWYVGAHLGHGEAGSLDGFLGGVQIGKNWQSGQIVYGWEADVTASDIGFEENFGPISAESSIDWMASARGRVGYLFHPDFLAYATAGLGLVSGSSSVSIDFPFDDDEFDDFDDEISFDDTETDFVLGLGIEGKLSHQSTLRVEYLGFSDTEVDVIRAGLNFKLGALGY